MMPSMAASSELLLLLLLLLPPVAVVVARCVARFAAWPEASTSQLLWQWPFPAQRKHAGRKAAPEQRDHQLRVSLYSKGGGEVECVVCLSGVEEGDEVRELRCRHLFHRGCLDRWLARPAATCPLCRCRLLAPSREEEEEEDDDDGYGYEDLVDGEDEDEEADSDMVLFMAYVHRSSSWFSAWLPPLDTL